MLAPYDSLPQPAADMAGTVLFLEAVPGATRRTVLQQWLQDMKQETMNWFLSCAFDEGGAWAGLQDLLQDIFPHLEQHAPALLVKHSYELCLTAPMLQRHIKARHLSLTDIAQEHEHVRNYPLDRAYRSLHGLIDLLDSWYSLVEQKPIVLVCDHFDSANPLVQRFFLELMRRRGEKMKITLLLAVAPGQSASLIDHYAIEHPTYITQLNLSPDAVTAVSQEHLTQDARELEQQVQQDQIVADTSTPQLISLLEQSGQVTQALYWKIQAVHRFNVLGLYEAGFRYCQEITDDLDIVRRDVPQSYALALLSLYFCYLSLGHAEQAYHIMAERGINDVHSQPFHSQCYYLVAMLYARFLPQRDLAKAIEYLEQGQALLSRATLSDATRYFYVVFLNNGLAYVRVQQKRAQEAIALCRGGLELLDEHLPPTEHRLHRSVLLYNIAQVYSAIKQFDAALATFEATMKIDPYYSEYYNDRGNIYFAMGHWQEAEQDYLKAIELSPPYPEVWINLGQCYREMGHVDDAIAAYTRALDLNPKAALPLAARAEMYAEHGQWEDALADYDASLHYEPHQPVVLAARAVAHYEMGQRELAVADLDAAIAFLPDNPVFYQNRALALIDLGYTQRAVEDLRMYLHLQPDAEDRDEVEQQLSLLPIP